MLRRRYSSLGQPEERVGVSMHECMYTRMYTCLRELHGLGHRAAPAKQSLLEVHGGVSLARAKCRRLRALCGWLETQSPVRPSSGSRSPTAAHTETSQQKHRPGGATQRSRFLYVHDPMNVYVSGESVAVCMRAIVKLFVNCQALQPLRSPIGF